MMNVAIVGPGGIGKNHAGCHQNRGRAHPSFYRAMEETWDYDPGLGKRVTQCLGVHAVEILRENNWKI